jgi:hypothetical protein
MVVPEMFSSFSKLRAKLGTRLFANICPLTPPGGIEVDLTVRRLGKMLEIAGDDNENIHTTTRMGTSHPGCGMNIFSVVTKISHIAEWGIAAATPAVAATPINSTSSEVDCSSSTPSVSADRRYGRSL